MITEEQLAEWSAMAEKATPGPWRHERDGIGDFVRKADGGLGSSVCTMVNDYSVDGPLIAASRTAVPALIAEVRRLQRELAFDVAPERGFYDVYDADDECHHCGDATAKGIFPDRERLRVALAKITTERDAMRAHAETLVEFAKTAPGRLPGLVQDAINALAKLDAVKP